MDRFSHSAWMLNQHLKYPFERFLRCVCVLVWVCVGGWVGGCGGDGER